MKMEFLPQKFLYKLLNFSMEKLAKMYEWLYMDHGIMHFFIFYFLLSYMLAIYPQNFL